MLASILEVQTEGRNRVAYARGPASEGSGAVGNPDTGSPFRCVSWARR